MNLLYECIVLAGAYGHVTRVVSSSGSSCVPFDLRDYGVFPQIENHDQKEQCTENSDTTDHQSLVLLNSQCFLVLLAEGLHSESCRITRTLRFLGIHELFEVAYCTRLFAHALVQLSF